MIRVHIICEGETEETFINEILINEFSPKEIWLYPSLLGKPGHKGGNVKFERFLVDIEKRLLGDTSAYCTTFFDFYGSDEEFPGKNEAKSKNSIQDKANCLLDAFQKKLEDEIGADPMRRFIPYVQMYEFEGLLFSNPEKLAQGINQSDLTPPFQKICNEFSTPEDINNSVATAPSKRILKEYPGYQKVTHGTLAALEIGLPLIRSKCHLFNHWLTRIEALEPIK